MPRIPVSEYKKALIGAARDIDRNHTIALAAGLSYYFVFSLFPLLIFIAAVLALVPIPHLFDQIYDLMARFLPPDSIKLVQGILNDVLKPGPRSVLSVGFLGMLWAASGGFAALMEALNVAYDVPETRPLWKTRPLAVGLTFLIGGLVILTLTLTFLGPEFGQWLAAHMDSGILFANLWPYIRWAGVMVFVVLAIELIYFLAPNVKQKFSSSLPGAIIAVTVWAAGSFVLGIYIRRYGNLNRTYGTLGAAIGLMMWFYFSAIAILVGAEINSELLKAQGKVLPMKCPPGKPECDENEQIAA